MATAGPSHAAVPPDRADWPPDRVDWPPDRADWPPDRADWPPDRVDWPPDRADWPPDRADWPPDRVDWPPDRADWPLAEQYQRRPGAADCAGLSYESKMLALIYSRMLRQGNQFQLASDMEMAGLFDDIVVKYRNNSNDNWKINLIQLKHKHGRAKIIPKTEFLSLNGALSLVKYSASFASVKSSISEQLQSPDIQFILYTNASIRADLVDEIESDETLCTGGKVVSFKRDGQVFRGLCEMVDFKSALLELHASLVGLGENEIGATIQIFLNDVTYKNREVLSMKKQLMETPTLEMLNRMLKKLQPLSDKETYSVFLSELKLYTGQAHEQELNNVIKEELQALAGSTNDLELDLKYYRLLDGVKSWGMREDTFLTQDSPQLLDIIKTQVRSRFSETINDSTDTVAELENLPLQVPEINLPDSVAANLPQVQQPSDGPHVKPTLREMLDAIRTAPLSDIRHLIEVRGGDLDFRGPESETIIHLAVRRGDIPILDYLSKTGISLEEKDIFGNTAMHNASGEGLVDAVAVLLEHGAKITATNELGETMLHVAVEGNHLNVVNLLLDKEVEFEYPDLEGNTSLHCSSRWAGVPVTQRLLDEGANVTAVNHQRENMLHQAARGRNVPVALLFDNINDMLEHPNIGGNTALHVAAALGSKEFVELLLSNGADILARNNEGLTPQDLAIRGGFLEVESLLEEAGEGLR